MIRVIAHEVNNSMAGVNSLLSVASQVVGERSPADIDLVELMAVCEERCRALSRFITSYADVVKIPEVVLCHADLNEAVDRWRVMLGEPVRWQGYKPRNTPLRR